MKVLIACEESQTVCKAFRKLGHEAYSCDILPCSGGHPEWHIQDDVLDVIEEVHNHWDLMIAHPPCTYLSKASACRLYKTAGNPDPERLALGMKAKGFLLKLLNAPIKFVAVENPTPLKIFELPSPSQIIQPYQFGHNVSKRTLLWIRGLPELKPTKIIDDYTPFLPSNTGGKKRGQMARTDKKLTRDPTIASKTFKGISEAMAKQWGDFILSQNNTKEDGFPPITKVMGIQPTIL